LNALRGHLAEIGVVAAQGQQHAYELGESLAEGADANGEIIIPDCVRVAPAPLGKQIEALDEEIAAIDKRLTTQVKADPTARRLMSIPGVGPIIASAILASVQNIDEFGSEREFSAFLGLTPRQNSSGGKERLGSITKMGDRYLRKLLVSGACSVVLRCKRHDDWVNQLLARKRQGAGGFKLVTVALANKMARIIFAILTSGKAYEPHAISG
jgi:transposase